MHRRAGMLGLGVLLLLGAGIARADDWSEPKPMSARSPSGRFTVAIEPSDWLGSRPVRMKLTDAHDPKASLLVYERDAVNSIAPVDIHVNDAGQVVTCDEWGSVGFQHAVVIYSPSGGVVIDKRLEEILPAAMLDRAKRSASSRWWRAGKKTSIDLKHATIATSWGAVITFELASGGEAMDGTTVAVPTDAAAFAAFTAGTRASSAVSVRVGRFVPKDGAPRSGTECQVSESGVSCITMGKRGETRRKLAKGALRTALAQCGGEPLVGVDHVALPVAYVRAEVSFTDAATRSVFDYVMLEPSASASSPCMTALRSVSGVQ